MTALTLPSLDFFNIESPKDLPTLQENQPTNIPSIINEIDVSINDINTYNNKTTHGSHISNVTSPTNEPNHNPTDAKKYANAGLAAIARNNQHRKDIKAKRVELFKTNNPMTKVSAAPRCPWKELPVTETKESYVLCCCLLVLLDIFCLCLQQNNVIRNMRIFRLWPIECSIGNHFMNYNQEYSS